MTKDILVYENDTPFLIAPRLEGIYSRTVRLTGYEMLSEVTCQVTGKKMEPHLFFSSLGEGNMASVLRFQLALVRALADYCRDRKLVICINANMSALSLVVSVPELMREVSELRDILRLEIDEDMQIHRHEHLLLAARELCPLWLDDFGRGDYLRQRHYVKYFEIIKIDRHFIHSVMAFSSGKRLLMEMVNDLRREGPCVVAEGVESVDVLHKMLSAGFDAFQGWLWKEEFITAEQLCRLKLSA
ncbi:EAL domain-containing protein [Enterobacter hormaechei]|uniref:EAL domain-containing protein n=1 Tax=Enterobacter hormaechei TaxID=158836 RepID=UPI0005F98A6C|nr:EAL domain-containing protein [Enterobacter hormaechei]EKZ5806915.1 EAL domain-containing protein [Klebsiella variicola]ELD3473128.1 EAL domain-containing protein [Enterobacter hormaechei]ELD3487824.1 EAL domain-containing protein [Enterobacter hormaechei]KJX14644.1 hypothetical protein SG64_22705 [Enterobacter hormaechei subsp. xiangfangensis]HCT5211531.1 EAL domain-containing protein [Enterobacter hormaechei]